MYNINIFIKSINPNKNTLKFHKVLSYICAYTIMLSKEAKKGELINTRRGLTYNNMGEQNTTVKVA